MTDGEGRIVLVNREIERLFGYQREELLGKPVETLVPHRFQARHPDHRSGFLRHPSMRAMGAGRDLYGLRKDGTEVPIEIGLTPVPTEEGMFILSVVVDISARKHAEEERRRLEDQLRQAQKMEAVGTLAGGIAHDFNNILGAIIGYAEFLRETVIEPQARQDLRDLLQAADRGKQLVQRILAFSRHQDQLRTPIVIGHPVAEAITLLRATLPPSVEIHTHIASDIPRVLADATSVHQIVMNLGTNAWHAMPGGGMIDVYVEPIYVRDSVARAHPELHEGPYVILKVHDNGCGIDPAIKDRVFEPFFTTKPPGSGTGLGLAMVHGILRDHEGTVDLDSVPHQGTTVTCFFPVIEDDTPSFAAEAMNVVHGLGERLLYVDDEPALVRIGERRLNALGYHVTAETDSRNALRQFAEDPQAFDAVVTDYLMPHMTGLELARELLRLRANIPILMLTGHMEEFPVEAIAEAGVRLIVKKPVTMQELTGALNTVLARG